MPCYTRISVEVKDRAIAEEILKKMGIKADIQKSAGGWTVTPQGTAPSSFEKAFKNEYAASVATQKAKAAGYSVVRKDVGNEIQLTLRQY